MITARDNAKLKDVRLTRRGKSDRAVLEGPHLVSAAAAAGVPLDYALATPAFLDSPAGRQLAGQLRTPIHTVAPVLLRGVSDADAPRGLLAVARLPRRGCDALPTPPASCVVVYLDGVQDPGNLGAVARVAEAAGAWALVCAPGCAHLNHPRALRASAGSLLRLLVARDATADALTTHLGPSFSWVALVPRGGEALFEAPMGRHLVLAVGAEGPGLSTGLLDRCGRQLTIPVAPAVESLNVAVAAGIALFEVRRRVG